MGFNEAKKYINDLHKKQDNPYLWPDYLTGLPDKAAIIQKVSEVYNQLGKKCISIIRIANVQPYLIKYGPDKHAEIIQWAAAVLKTTADKYKGFVGACCTHDFVAVCDTKDSEAFINEASELFEEKILKFYSNEDLKKGRVFSFMRDSKRIDIGFMKFIVCTITDKNVSKDDMLPRLGKLCVELEKGQYP